MLSRISSPHAKGATSTQRVMLDVSLATLPGFAALCYFFGWGTLINVIWASLLAVAMEAAVMLMRKRPVGFYIKDYSAIVTAILLALAIPPYAPWWLTFIGIFFSIVIAKHLYGGLGYNPFNPAMIGYVVLLISFPVQMTQWPQPAPVLPDHLSTLNLWQSVQQIFGLASPLVDGLTGATALDIVKQNTGLMLSQLQENTAILANSFFASSGIEWVNVGFLIGGIFLLIRRTYTWHAPAGMLLMLLVLPALFYDGGSSSSAGSPLFHLFTGATMLGAFFIITDPVSGATTNIGRFIFGAGVGLLTFIIRYWGNYPDAVAFAVLLMNFAAPLLDRYTLPRTYGHDKAKRARIAKD